MGHCSRTEKGSLDGYIGKAIQNGINLDNYERIIGKAGRECRSLRWDGILLCTGRTKLVPAGIEKWRRQRLALPLKNYRQ